MTPHLRPSALVAATLAGLVACGPIPNPVAGLGGGGEPEDACGATQQQALVGRDISVLNAVELPENTRLLLPGSVATQDFSAERLNISVDETDTITQVACG